MNQVSTLGQVFSCKIDPLFPADELYGIVGANLKRNFDVREVCKVELWAVSYAIIVYAMCLNFVWTASCVYPFSELKSVLDMFIPKLRDCCGSQ